jgi:hypothetical protein
MPHRQQNTEWRARKCICAYLVNITTFLIGDLELDETTKPCMLRDSHSLVVLQYPT